MNWKLYSDIQDLSERMQRTEEMSFLLLAACNQYMLQGEKNLAKETVSLARRNFTEAEEVFVQLSNRLSIYKFKGYVNTQDSEGAKTFMRQSIQSAYKRAERARRVVCAWSNQAQGEKIIDLFDNIELLTKGVNEESLKENAIEILSLMAILQQELAKVVLLAVTQLVFE